MGDEREATIPVDHEMAWRVGAGRQAGNEIESADGVRTVGDEVPGEFRLSDCP